MQEQNLRKINLFLDFSDFISGINKYWVFLSNLSFFISFSFCYLALITPESAQGIVWFAAESSRKKCI